MMVTLTSDFESDSFLSEMSIHGDNKEEEENDRMDHIRRTFDIQNDQLNQMTSNNRELINVQSQLARLRSELEKSEMLRQTLEYELTLLRTQHGKQTAFTHQLQNQFHLSNEQIKQLQLELNHFNEDKQNQLKDKDHKIQELENESETLHERERRIETLNEQIQKMEKTFHDSECLARKHLAQSILTKERESELKKEYQLIQIKLQYSEQALEQERQISNEAKLNVQLLTSRLADLEINYETLKNTSKNQERKLEEFQKQSSNEKLLRSTLSKIQSELELKCAESQKTTIDYDKQLKNLREELANYRRKYRNNEEKYSQVVNKTFELLRLTKIINDTYQTDLNLPTLKQLEELKLCFEQFKTYKIDQTNEINRLKKTIERLNKSSITQKQFEHATEITCEKLEIELDQCREKTCQYEENLIRLKRDREQLVKEMEKKCEIIHLVELKLKKLLGNCSSNISHDLNELEKQFEQILSKSNLLEEKLIEKENCNLQFIDKLQEQILHLKFDFDQKHQLIFKEKDHLKQKYLNEIQQLNLQLQTMEKRTHEVEHRLTNETQSSQELIEQSDQMYLIVKHLISLWIPLRRRYLQLIETNHFLKDDLVRYEQIKQIFHSNHLNKNRFRIYVITIIAFQRFDSLKKVKSLSSLTILPSTNILYDQSILSTLKKNFIQNINFNQIFQSLFIQLNRLDYPIQKGSLMKLISAGLHKSSSYTKTNDLIHSLIIRLDQSECKLHDKENDYSQLEKSYLNIQTDLESRIAYEQFERLCDELQRALEREKQAQDLLNEQNNQLKSLTNLIQQTQNEKDFLQDKFNRNLQNEIYSKEKIQQLTKSHQQMEENIKRAEKAIRLVVSDKEMISIFCTRINSLLNLNEKQHGLENVHQLISQLETFIQLPDNKSPPEMILCQTMAKGFIHLLNHLKEFLNSNQKDIQSLKEHCQILTEQFEQLSQKQIEQLDLSSTSSQTILVQAHPIQVQVNHHPQSVFKPIQHHSS